MRNSRRIATLETEIADLKAAVERLQPRPVVIHHKTVPRVEAEAVTALLDFDARMRRSTGDAR